MDKEKQCHVCGQPLRTKICSRCKMTLPIGDFYGSRTGSTGLSSQCRACIKLKETRDGH
jgi:hypothetical protein